MICTECGNQIVQGCGPVCLVCQHTGRVTATEVKQSVQDAILEHTASALDAVYAALNAAVENTEAKLTVIEAQQMLRHRIRNPGHNRPRANWEMEDQEERECEPVCQSCMGTRRHLTLPCPDCSEDGDRERE
jgi:hypothetical protein